MKPIACACLLLAVVACGVDNPVAPGGQAVVQMFNQRADTIRSVTFASCGEVPAAQMLAAGARILPSGRLDAILDAGCYDLDFRNGVDSLVDQRRSLNVQSRDTAIVRLVPPPAP
jgi:hypothetical protein